MPSASALSASKDLPLAVLLMALLLSWWCEKWPMRQRSSWPWQYNIYIYIYYMYICWLSLCVWLCLAIEIVLPPLWDAKKSSSKHFYGSGSSSPKEWPFDLSPRGESILFAVPPVPCFFFWQHESIPIIWCASALDAWRDMDESYGGGEEQSQEISNGAKRHRSYCANKYKEQIQCLCSISQICCLKNI